MLLNALLHVEITGFCVSGLLTGSDIWLSKPSNKMLFFRSNCVCCGWSYEIFFECPLDIFTCRSICDCLMSQGPTNTELFYKNCKVRNRERERERLQTSKHRYNMMTALRWKIKWLHQYSNLTECPKSKNKNKKRNIALQ